MRGIGFIEKYGSGIYMINVLEKGFITIFDDRTQMNADNQDFKYNFDSKSEIKRKAFDNLRK